jgi:hypothetical protein
MNFVIRTPNSFQTLTPRIAEVVTSGGTWVKARGLKDRNPFTQRMVQQATYVRLQYKADTVKMHPVGTT